jgi:hypothetical protein
MATVASKQFFLSRNGEKFGPYSGSAVRAMGRAGEITSSMKIWAKGMDRWMPVEAVKGLTVTQDAPTTPPPVAAQQTAGHVTVEKTSKRLKAQMLVNWVAFLVALVVFVVTLPTQENPESRTNVVSVLVMFATVVAGIYLRVSRWWNHG